MLFHNQNSYLPDVWLESHDASAKHAQVRCSAHLCVRTLCVTHTVSQQYEGTPVDVLHSSYEHKSQINLFSGGEHWPESSVEKASLLTQLHV